MPRCKHLETSSIKSLRPRREESAKLQRHFGRFDVFFFLVCTLVGLDTIGSVASNGAEGFTWLIVLAIVFFAPYALLTSELGTTFPAEGGPYVWTRMALGRFWAAINAVIYWAANPIWLGGTLTITAVTVFGEFFTPLHGVAKWLFAVLFIWIAVWGAILSLDKGKWLPTIGAFIRIVLLSVFVATVIVYGIEHGVHGFGIGSFKPTYAVFIAAVPVLFFNYVGFELPSAAGEELKNPQRDVPFTVFRAGITTVLLYGAPVLAILLVLPTSQVTNLGGFIEAMKTVFTVYGGHVASDGTATLTGFGTVLGDIAAAGFILALLTSGMTWIMGADRAQAVACYDGCGPRRLGVISERLGTPVADEPVLGGAVDGRDGTGVRADQRQRREVLLGRARPGDLDHDDLLPADLPRARDPALQVPRCASPVPRAGRALGRGRVQCAHLRVGATGDGRAAVARLWHLGPGLRPRRARVRRPATAVRALAIHPAAGAGGGRRRFLRAGARHPPAHGVSAADGPRRRGPRRAGPRVRNVYRFGSSRTGRYGSLSAGWPASIRRPRSSSALSSAPNRITTLVIHSQTRKTTMPPSAP